MPDTRWVLALAMTSEPLICDGCQGVAAELYRPYGEPRLHGLLCRACTTLPGIVVTDPSSREAKP